MKVKIAEVAIYEANFNFSVVLAKMNGTLLKNERRMKKVLEIQKFEDEEKYSALIFLIDTQKICSRTMQTPSIVTQIINWFIISPPLPKHYTANFFLIYNILKNLLLIV